MCNCLEEQKQRLIENKDKFSELKGKELKDTYFINTGWSLNSSGLKLFIPFRYEYENVTKSGKVTQKKKEVLMSISHCPFCGEKLD